jgi:hypothetical protein
MPPEPVELNTETVLLSLTVVLGSLILSSVELVYVTLAAGTCTLPMNTFELEVKPVPIILMNELLVAIAVSSKLL